jgi:hypothetical protein
MVEGFEVDQTHGASTVPTWVEGKPQRSIWTGVALGGRPRFEIATWRCNRCGFLEHYASAEPSRHEQRRRQAVRAVVIVAVVAAFLLSIAGALLATSG